MAAGVSLENYWKLAHFKKSAQGLRLFSSIMHAAGGKFAEHKNRNHTEKC
jgi:hypothetical protein